MKSINKTWLLGAGLLVVALPVLGVNPDVLAPCWRDGSGATRQVWTFDTAMTTNSPGVPGTKVNQPGSPLATMKLGTLGQGWEDTGCVWVGNGCGPVVTAVLPLNPPDGNGPPYESIQYGFNGGAPYSDPPLYGTAQGFIDFGKTGNRLDLTVPNSGAPAGTLRYFYLQGTYYVASGIAGFPSSIAVTNSAGVGTTTQVGSAVSVTVDQPLDSAGDLRGGNWRNRRLTIVVPAATGAGSDVVTIMATGGAFWTDAVIVETLDRVAADDALNASQDTVTNIPFAQLLANDRGATNVIGVGATNHCYVTLGGGNAVFTPEAGYTGAATFWYTNRDCGGLTNLGAQVTVTVVENVAPVATDKSFNRSSGVSMKLTIASLLSGDTDSDGGTIHFDGMSSTTTNGAALTNDATYVYVPARAVADAFTYTINDGQGGTATANVYLSIVSASGQAGGVTPGVSSARAVFYGVPGVNYHVQRATNALFTLGLSNFSSVTTPGDGVITVVDDFGDLGAVPGSAFYRLLIP